MYLAIIKTKHCFLMHVRSPGNPGDVKIVRLSIRFLIFSLEPGERLLMHGTIISEYYQEIPQSQSAGQPCGTAMKSC